MKRVKIVWSLKALSHFSNWIQYIAKDSLKTSQKERDEILKAITRLQRFPYSGRIVPEFSRPNLREIIQKPIRIIYRLKENEIYILAFHHSKRQLDLALFS